MHRFCGNRTLNELYLHEIAALRFIILFAQQYQAVMHTKIIRKRDFLFTLGAACLVYKYLLEI